MSCISCEWKKGMANPKKGKKLPGTANGKCTRPEGFCENLTAQEAQAVEIIEPEEQFDITLHLTSEEKSHLEQCETIIRKNIKAFFEAGQALSVIRDNRLYREKYKTFEQYCKQEWDFSRVHAHRQIQSYEAIENLKMLPIGNKNEDVESEIIELNEIDGTHHTVILPQNEAQTRPLTKLKNPEDQVKAWEIVLDQLNQGKKLTSFLIAQAVKEVKGERLEETVTEKKQTVEKTQLLTNIFKRQYQVLLDIVYEEKCNDWKTSSQKEVVRYLKELIKIAESD